MDGLAAGDRDLGRLDFGFGVFGFVDGVFGAAGVFGLPDAVFGAVGVLGFVDGVLGFEVERRGLNINITFESLY